MSEKREGKQIYRCKGKGCNYATDNLDAFIKHIVDERTPKSVEEPTWGEETPKGHRTVKEYLECPECYPKFEKGLLEHPKLIEELEKRGYIKKKTKAGLRL